MIVSASLDNVVSSPRFAYFLGLFAADGSYYRDGRCCRFEITDGSSIENEMIYSKNFLENVRCLVRTMIGKNIPELRRRGNRYILHFRSKMMERVFNSLGIKPEPKSTSFRIPKIYRDSTLEKFFWLGVMDGDGMVARVGRKVALEMVNKEMVHLFGRFISKNGIFCRVVERRFDESSVYETQNTSFKVIINAPFIRKYKEILGFCHPRKRMWLERHSKNKNGYIENTISCSEFLSPNGNIDYIKVFRCGNVFVVGGKRILRENGIRYRGASNVSFIKMRDILLKSGHSESDICRILSGKRWKMSKGSVNSVNLPDKLNKDILDVVKLLRPAEGGIRVSRTYAKSLGFNADDVVKAIEKTFDIKAKYTGRGEPIFCSGVLKELFLNIIKRENKEYDFPEWHKEIICQTTLN